MSANYTQGTLKIAGRDTRSLPHTLVAARTLLFRVYSEAFGDHEQEHANARRLVACWNVCDGMSTESLELMPGQFFKPLNQRLLAVEAQREELLKALKSVLQWIDDNCETTGFEEIEAQADAAILTCGEASSSPAAPLTIPTTSVLIGQSLVMAELLKTAVAVIRTIPGDTTEESDALQELIDQSEAAIAAVLTEHAMPKAAGEVPHG